MSNYIEPKDQLESVVVDALALDLKTLRDDLGFRAAYDSVRIGTSEEKIPVRAHDSV